MNEKNVKNNYPVMRNTPVARFFYQGNKHTHPVRRTVLLIESTRSYIRGYELREGSRTRSYKAAPIKTYRLNKIAKINQIDRRRTLRTKTPLNELSKTTLRRANLVNLVQDGV